MTTPSERIKLPQKKDDLAMVLHRHFERETMRAMPLYTVWKIASYYLLGYRRFNMFNPRTGHVSAYMTDADGKMSFQSQKLLTMINEIADTISEMDVRPSVTRGDTTLGSIRDRATVQTIMDSISDDKNIRQAKEQFAYLCTALGSAGLTGDVSSSPTLGLTSSYSVIHPRELFPFPSLGDDYTQAQGIGRQRILPLDYLAEKLGNSVRSDKALKEMEWFELETGDVYFDPYSYGQADNNGWSGLTLLGYDGLGLGNGRNGSGSSGKKKTGETMAVVRVREIWMETPNSTCDRYASSSGMHLFEDADFRGQERPMPIGFSRFLNNGSWHGAGMFHVAFSMHRELEKMLQDLFKNIRSIDQYGVLVMPAGQVNERNLTKSTGKGLRLLSYASEGMYGDAAIKPFSISPHNSGEIPGKTALLAQGMLDQLNPLTDLVQNKGRVDSANGLQILEEEGRRKMRRSLAEIADAFATIHKFNAGKSLHMSAETAQPFKVNNISLDLVGAVVDFEKETLAFTENRMPDIHSVGFTVRNAVPQNREVKKQNAIQYAQSVFAKDGVVDEDGLKLYLIQEGYEVEAWMEEEKNAYESVVRNILKLYGNGQENQSITVNPHTSRAALQLRVVNAFMSGIVFERASVKVQNDFIQYKQQLQQHMGGVLPEHIQNPDDYAMRMAQSAAAQGIDPTSGQPMVAPPGNPIPISQGVM